MKKTYLIILVISALLLSACTATISEASVQTAVAQIVLTQEAANPQAEAAAADGQQPEAQVDPAVQAELEQAQQALEAVQLQLTEQAGQIAQLQEAAAQQAQAAADQQAAEQVAAEAQPTPTNTPIPTATAFPTVASTPSYQKAVIATRNAPMWTYKRTNEAGRPLMVKVEPILRYEEGQEFLVNLNFIVGDGGLKFYEVLGPLYAGYYVDVTHVRDR